MIGKNESKFIYHDIVLVHNPKRELTLSSLQRDTLLRLGMGGRGRTLVLPQEGDGTHLVDFPGEFLCSLKCRLGFG